MQELIDRLVAKAGISAEQAQHVIEAVKDYVKEKFPMLEGAVDSVFRDTSAKGEDLLGGLKDKMEGYFH
jgi:polyhydroxyalkanoate synthesis regulator phasin